MTIINIFVSGDEPRKVIFKDDLGCDEACKEQNSSKEDCDQQRVDSEPVTNNQGKGNSILLPKLFWQIDRGKLLKFEAEGQKFEITRTIYSSSERSEQFLVKERFLNLFLEISHV